MWRVELLGKVQIVRGDNGSVVSRFESRKVSALLARLALFPNRIHPREELAALLWPDADRASGLARLRHVLSSLGRQTAEGERGTGPLFIVDRFAARIGENVECDAVQFEKAVTQKQFSKARILYAGDLLPGFYDDWLISEQERFRALFESIPPAPPSSSAAIAPVVVVPLPSPVPRQTMRGFLPHYLTAFWGRDVEKEQFAALLWRRRLITIVGPVGCGKTRFMVEAVRSATAPQAGFPLEPFDQIVYVSLTDCAVPEHILHRVRVALQIPPGSESPLEQIAVAFGDTRLLLLLDRTEHLSDGAGEVIEELLARLPHARCVASSRRLLHVPGEQAFALEPLLPPEAGASLEAVRQNPCVALLCDRAQTVRPDFAITSRNYEAAALLCRHLEGIPLALELAASRVRVFSFQQMCEQMQQSETDGNDRSQSRWSLTTPPAFAASKGTRRHPSLREAVAASWQLLGARQQKFLAAVSVLRGEWTVSFASAVSGETNEAARLLLEELADHSLIQSYLAPGDESETRFALLQTIGEFAGDQLPVPRRFALRRRFGEYVLDELQKGEVTDAIAPADLFAWEAALVHAITDGEADEALSLCSAFDDVWLRIGNTGEALDLVRQALALDGGSAVRRAEACEVASCLAALSLDLPLARALARSAWENAENAAGNGLAHAAARLAQGRAAYVEDAPHQTISALLNEAETAARRNESANARILGGALNLHGASCSRVHDYVTAERYFNAAQTLLEQSPHPSRVRINRIRFNRAVVASESGDSIRALLLLDDCLREARLTGDVKIQAEAHQNKGAIFSGQGRWQDSVVALRDAIRQMHALGMEYGLAFALWNTARPMLHNGDVETAVALMAFARRFWVGRGGPLSAADEAACQSVYDEAAKSTGSNKSSVAGWQAEGEKWTLHEAVQFALGPAL